MKQFFQALVSMDACVCQVYSNTDSPKRRKGMIVDPSCHLIVFFKTR